jgi:protein AFG1
LSKVYYDPLSPENELEIDKIFNSFVSADPNDPPITNRKLTTWGRTILVPESTSSVAKFNFDDLCGQPLSAADYLEVTKNFGTVFLLKVPKMDLNKKDMVLFFVD